MGSYKKSTDSTPFALDVSSTVEAWPRGYKTFFMLNSDEQEILNAHKFENIEKVSLF